MLTAVCHRDYRLQGATFPSRGSRAAFPALDQRHEGHETFCVLVRDCVRQIVEELAGACRIFNLSLGLEECSTVLSPYASDLDALAREYDAVFVVSAGNRHPWQLYPDASKVPSHPDYLLAEVGAC